MGQKAAAGLSMVRKMEVCSACDQDTINGALKGEILPMTPRYNSFFHQLQVFFL